MAPPAVETRRLTKAFGVTPVLREIDFQVDAGRCALLIGGNGSGKSTLLRILAGLSQPTSGDAILFGENSSKLGLEQRRRIGMLTHQAWLYPNLTARENLEFFAELYGVCDHDLVARWIVSVGLTAAADERVREFSRGMEQRLSLARAMMMQPDLLLLDEPLAGLDPDAVSIVGELLRKAVARGCAALITAHSIIDLGLEMDRYQLTNGRVLPLRDETRAPQRTRMGA